MTRQAPLMSMLLTGVLIASALPTLGSGKITAPNMSSGAQSESTGKKIDKDQLIEQLATALEAAEQRNKSQERLITILMDNDEHQNRELIVMLQRSHAGMKATCDRLMAAEALYRDHRRAMEEQMTADQVFIRQMELEQRGVKGKLYAFDWVAMHRSTMEQFGRSTRNRFDADQALSNGLAKIVLPKVTEPEPPQRLQPPLPSQRIARR